MSSEPPARPAWQTGLSLLALVLGAPCACSLYANLTTEGAPLAVFVAVCFPALSLALGMLAWQGVGALRAVAGLVRALFAPKKGPAAALQDEFDGQPVPPGAIALLLIPPITGLAAGAAIALVTRQSLVGSTLAYGGFGLLYGIATYGLARAGYLAGPKWWSERY